MKNKNSIDPMIPFKFYAKREKQMFEQMLKLKQEFGLRRFLITAPGNGVRLTGFPSEDVYRELGELLLRIKEKMALHDIEIGWWCAPSLKSGKGTFQNITGIDGTVSEISSCPLDSDFKETFSDNVAIVAKIAKPFMIQFEDDYELSNHVGVPFGCFCPLHLEEFAKKQKRCYSREELLDIFSEVNTESIRLRRAWAELSCGSLTSLAALIRDKVDVVSPETRMALCQAGCVDFDGDMTEPVARALAGKKRPAVRLFGSSYSSDNGARLPREIFHALYSAQHLPDDFELFHESDTYPHTRFFMSSSKLKTLMTAAFSYGLDDSLFYTTQYLDDSAEESGYSSMFKTERERFNALKKAVVGCEVEGCEIIYEPFEHVVVPYDPKNGQRPSQAINAWANILGRFGIPYTSKNGKVKMLSGTTAKFMSDEQIRELLSGSVFMDGKAASYLAERGFSELTGTDVVQGGKATFCYEGMRDIGDFENIKGRLMYNFIFAPAGSEGGSFYELKPLAEAEVLTDFLDPDEKPVMPGMIRFENKLGGRVAITAFDLTGNESSSIFNYRKKEIVHRVIEWLGRSPLPVYVDKMPNAFCIFNRSQLEDVAIVTITNLSTDSHEELNLKVCPEFKDSKVELLNGQGEWEHLEYIVDADKMIIKTGLNVLSPVILRLTKKENL
jgi:hypothetical protein